MKIYRQRDSADCGPTCLRMISAYFGKEYSLPFITNLCQISREGASMYGLSKAAEAIGLKPILTRLSLDFWKPDSPLPAILFWGKSHFVILQKVSYSRITKKTTFYIIDPSYGKVTLPAEDFFKKWLISNEDHRGYALFLEPTDEFYQKEEDYVQKKGKITFIYFLGSYLKRYRKHLSVVILAMITGSLLSFVAPFITQNLIDRGVKYNDLGFIRLLLFFQAVLFFAGIVGEIIRNYLLRHISARINISVLSNFLYKLMKLPLSFYDSKMKGDIVQRINDYSKLERIITSSGLNFLISLTYIIVFSIVLAYYNFTIFIIFLCSSILTVEIGRAHV